MALGDTPDLALLDVGTEVVSWSNGLVRFVVTVTPVRGSMPQMSEELRELIGTTLRDVTMEIIRHFCGVDDPPNEKAIH